MKAKIMSILTVSMFLIFQTPAFAKPANSHSDTIERLNKYVTSLTKRPYRKSIKKKTPKLRLDSLETQFAHRSDLPKVKLDGKDIHILVDELDKEGSRVIHYWDAKAAKVKMIKVRSKNNKNRVRADKKGISSLIKNKKDRKTAVKKAEVSLEDYRKKLIVRLNFAKAIALNYGKWNGRLVRMPISMDEMGSKRRRTKNRGYAKLRVAEQAVGFYTKKLGLLAKLPVKSKSKAKKTTARKTKKKSTDKKA